MLPPNKPSLKTISPSIFSPVISKRAVWYRDIALSFVASQLVYMISASPKGFVAHHILFLPRKCDINTVYYHENATNMSFVTTKMQRTSCVYQNKRTDTMYQSYLTTLVEPTEIEPVTRSNW